MWQSFATVHRTTATGSDGEKQVAWLPHRGKKTTLKWRLTEGDPALGGAFFTVEELGDAGISEDGLYKFSLIERLGSN